MTQSAQQPLNEPAGDTETADAVSNRHGLPVRGRLLLAMFGVAALFALFAPTVLSMFAIWWRSDTFAHGMLVFPIVLFLIWRQRHEVTQMLLETNYAALAPLAGLGFVWLVANVTDVQVVQQAAFVLMIPAMVWLLLGWRATWTMAFPLAFLLFAVPVGEGLIYPMMQFTASFTVYALRLTGLPVFWDGTFFSIPSGDWSVVEGCSGVRYLIASVFLGTLYAYMVYRALWRRLLFIGLSIVIPIVANGFRAYMIVMIAHLSNHKLAHGIDHFIYVWVWFGIVMLILFWVGTLWREPPTEQVPEGTSTATGSIQDGWSRRGAAVALGVGLLVAAVWPVWSAYIIDQDSGAITARFLPPEGIGGWRTRGEHMTNWVPQYKEPTASVNQVYEKPDGTVGLFVAYYGRQEQGAELINSQNVMVRQKHPVWRMPVQRLTGIELNGRATRVYESELKSARQNLLAWHWYWVGERHTANPYLAKLLEALWQLKGRGRYGAGIVVYTEFEEDKAAARQTLREYVTDMLPALEASLDAMAAQRA